MEKNFNLLQVLKDFEAEWNKKHEIDYMESHVDEYLEEVRAYIAKRKEEATE